MNIKIFFLILLIIFYIPIISGCPGTSTGNGSQIIQSLFGSGQGLTITNYTSTRNSIRFMESTEIKTTYENKGDFQAQNIEATIYGYGELSIPSNKSYLMRVDSGLSDFMFWLLRADTLGQSMATYQINTRIFYWYGFEGREQVAFIPQDYAGDTPRVSKTNLNSPLKMDVEAGSPVRTIGESGDYHNFSITVTVKNEGMGEVMYKNDNEKDYKLNNLAIQVPISWEIIEMGANWGVETLPEDGVKRYIIDYDTINEEINRLECKTSTINRTQCELLIKSIQSLWLVRGEESRVLMQFRRPVVTDVTIDTVKVYGTFSYLIDTRDFKSTITLQVNQ